MQTNKCELGVKGESCKLDKQDVTMNSMLPLYKKGKHQRIHNPN